MIDAVSVEVTTFRDVPRIGNPFGETKVVRVSFLADVDEAERVRVVDFMSGLCYGRGEIRKSEDDIFLLIPREVEP